MSRNEIPPERALLDCLTRIDNLIEIQIKTSRRTNELLEMLLGIRPPSPEVVVVPPLPAPPAVLPPVPAVPPVPELKAIYEILDRIEEILKPVTDYLSEEKDAPKSPQRIDYDLKKKLMRSALNGYIANGGPGDLQVKINRLETIRVANGEILDFNYYFKRPLEIKYVEVTTPTTATFRILLW